MASLRDQFDAYYAPSTEAIGTVLRTGLVSLETNVLLSLYRFQSRARDELFLLLEQLGNQLWIPHQVALEFHQNRLNVIAEQEGFFGKTREDLEAVFNDYVKKFRTFANRIALLDVTSNELIDRVQKTHAAVDAVLSSAEEDNEVHLDGYNSDRVLARLEALLTNRVGDPFDPDELEEARKEAKRRGDAKIPPGYMDRGKSDPAGDYILWKQLKQEAAKREVPVLLITDDRKEDWFRRQQGLTLGPRIELYEEMRKDSKVPLLLMTTETFLIQSKEHLSVPVSSSTVNQAKELPGGLVGEDLLSQMAERQQLLESYASLSRLREELRQRLINERKILRAADIATSNLARDPDDRNSQEFLRSIDLESLRKVVPALEKELARIKAVMRQMDKRIQRYAPQVDL